MSMFTEPILFGFLKKRKMSKKPSYPFSKWNKRWFILREDRLMYFKSKTEVDPSRVYFLKDVISTEEIDESTITIQHSVGVITLQSIENTITQWRVELQKAIEKVHQQAFNRKTLRLRLRSGTVPRVIKSSNDIEDQEKNSTGTVPTPKEAFLEHIGLPESPRSWTDKSPRIQSSPMNRRSLTLTRKDALSIEDL